MLEIEVIFMFDRENENYIYEVVSNNMKRIRKEKGLIQAQVAERMSYSTQFISNIESKIIKHFL